MDTRTTLFTRWIATSILALAAGAGPARALTVDGNAGANSGGGAPAYQTLPGPESTTGLMSSNGTCSSATAKAWASVSSGALSLADNSSGAAGVSCVGSSDGHGNSSFYDTYQIQSASLPPGTLVDVSLCLKVAIRHGMSFSCGGSVYEGVVNTASVNANLSGGSTSSPVYGTYSERWNCYDGHDVSEAGMLAGGGSSQTLALTQVPVGSYVTVSASLTSSTSETSFSGLDTGHIEMALPRPVTPG